MNNNYLETLKQLRSKREMERSNVTLDELSDVIEHARYAASARNQQRLRYALVCDDEAVDVMFNATNLPVTHNIDATQAPSAFIVIGILEDAQPDFRLGIDCGIAVQVIRESLLEKGYASVDILSFDKKVFKERIGVENFYPLNIISVGKSIQQVDIEDSNEDVTNYRNDQDIHTVRKLTTNKLIIKKL